MLSLLKRHAVHTRVVHPTYTKGPNQANPDTESGLVCVRGWGRGVTANGSVSPLGPMRTFWNRQVMAAQCADVLNGADCVL